MINLHKDEEILTKHRKHWFIFVSHAAPLVLLFLVPLFFIPFSEMLRVPLAQFGSYLPDALHDTALWWFIGAAWFLLVWTVIFVEWTDYYLDVWVATNKRVIDVDQKGFFNREVAECRYERVQDVTVNVRGIIASLLDFGDVHIQTAGTNQDIVIQGVARPNALRDFISRESDRIFTAQHEHAQHTAAMRESARQLDAEV